MGQRATTIVILIGAAIVGTMVGIGTAPRTIAAKMPAATATQQDFARSPTPPTPPSVARDTGVADRQPALPAPPVARAPVRDLIVSEVSSRGREATPNVVWAGCDDARVAGAAPIYRGQAGYRVEMDGDGDGIACEPIRH